MVELTPEKIAREIEKTGYPLELRTAEKLQRSDSHIAHNLYYVDEDEKKGREVDLRWLRNIRKGPKEGSSPIWVRYCLAIECKKPTKPWVCLTSPRSSYDQTIASALFFGLPELVLSREELIEAGRRHPLFGSEIVGRGFFEAFKAEGGDQSRMFGAVATAVKATLAMHRAEFAATTGNSLCFYYPLIVIDGRLYEGRLNGEEVVAEEVGSSTISFSYASPAYGDQQILVPVVRIEELDPFIEEFDQAHGYVADRILAAIAQGKYEPKRSAT